MSEAGLPDASAASTPQASRSFIERVFGVLRLDGGAYEEIAADPAAMGQAATVVVAAAVGRALSAMGGPFSEQGLLFLVQVPALWPVSAGLVLGIGRAFGHETNFARCMRLVGFALAPFALTALGAIPIEPLRIAIAFLSVALLLATLVVAVRHALQTVTSRAAFVTLVVVMILVFVSLVYAYATA